MFQRTVGGSGEDERLSAVNADVPQVVEQRVVGRAPVAQGHELLQRHTLSTVIGKEQHILSPLFSIKYGLRRFIPLILHQRKSEEILL